MTQVITICPKFLIISLETLTATLHCLASNSKRMDLKACKGIESLSFMFD